MTFPSTSSILCYIWVVHQQHVSNYLGPGQLNPGEVVDNTWQKTPHTLRGYRVTSDRIKKNILKYVKYSSEFHEFHFLNVNSVVSFQMDPSAV